jgi:rRNA maturation RNase YbeY
MHGLTEGAVNVILIRDPEMQEFNKLHRGIDEPTDVLTFPAPGFAIGELGDIAISMDFVERAAKKRRVPLSEEAAFLAIHGGLHLAGFDDITDDQRLEMQREMNRAAIEVGLTPEPEWTSMPHGADDA